MIKKLAHPLVFILIATVAVFSRAFYSGYVEWDDNVFIARNIQLTFPFFEAVQAAFSKFYYGDYLPLTLMSYWFEVAIFGQDPVAQHVTNLVLHCIDVCLLYVWLSKVMTDRRLALFATAIFAIHPMQSEVVMWISERKSLLCIMFTLLAMLTVEKSWADDKLKWRILYPVLFLCALLSKATTIFLPVLLVVLDLFVLKRPWKKSAVLHAPIFLISFVIGVTRIIAYRASTGEFQARAIEGGALTEMPLRFFDTLGFYVKKFFWAAPQSIIYPDFSIGTIDYWNYVAIALVIAFVAYYGWMKRDRRVVFFALAYFFFLLPVLQIVPRINYVNDRMSYLPLVAISGLLYVFAEKVMQEKALKYLWIAALVILVVPSYSRTEVWETNLNLWEDTVQKSPWSAIAHHNYGLELSERNRFDEAIRQYQIAAYNEGRGVSDVTAMAYNNMAVLHSRPDLGKLYDLKQAEASLRQALKFTRSPLDRLTMKYNLGGLLAGQGYTTEATQILTELLSDLRAMPDLSSHQLIPLVERKLEQLKAQRR
ncbi:MAG: glycosyltransferase family 39 protein [Bdellovibrionota bacterium]